MKQYCLSLNSDSIHLLYNSYDDIFIKIDIFIKYL